MESPEIAAESLEVLEGIDPKITPVVKPVGLEDPSDSKGMPSIPLISLDAGMNTVGVNVGENVHEISPSGSGRSSPSATAPVKSMLKDESEEEKKIAMAEAEVISGTITPPVEKEERKRIVIVGLGMVAVAFIEKLLKLDSRRQEYTIVVVGEEPHVAYNRVGLTSFFQHRKVESLYLNPQSWYEDQKSLGTLNYFLNTRVTDIYPAEKKIKTVSQSPPPDPTDTIDNEIHYDMLVLATGSDAVLPTSTPGYDAQGVFVYRNIDDLEKLISYSQMPGVRGHVGAVVGGGLLGLEAAKAMLDLEAYSKVVLIDKNKWVLSRQLDEAAGSLVGEKIRELGVDLRSVKRVQRIETGMAEGEDEEGTKKAKIRTRMTGVVFENGETMQCKTICYAIGIKPRDELARRAGMRVLERGGIIVNDKLQTSDPHIYAIGECASWNNQTYGLIAPGVEMADVLAFNLTQAKAHSPRVFKRPDLSTKLKLLGVEVASFGDFFADRDGPMELPGRAHGSKSGTTDKRLLVKALTYKDPFLAVYKKYLFSMDGKYLLGGMMIGDTNDYVKLVGMVKNKKVLEVPPSQFILGAKKEGEENLDELDDDTQVCSCHNVTKGDIVQVVKDGTCTSIGDVKSCTKAGTGCAGCMPLVQSIFNAEMKKLGQEVSNHLCPHFAYSRVDLFNIISVKNLKSLPEVMQAVGRIPDSLGCEVCKPALASIFASLHNYHVMSTPQHGLQDTNDKFLANIQRNGTFSVIPRVAGGEITPDKLIVIGQVAKKYGLYCKITGGQRIDMFGAKKQDLLNIWTELVDAGMESGHAYAKSLRTIKSCVGTTWCRFGIGDSVGMAIRLEERYKSIRAPHKIKSGVSGCVRECAEAQNKDFGLIATEKGFNIFVGGNGGAKPKHSELLIKDCPPDEVIPVIDRYLMFYIRTADRLQRTARWLENLPGGISYLKDVILNDKLGICAELERQMQELVGSYFCEWTEVVRDPSKRKMFQQFSNTSETQETVEIIQERGQQRPTYWPKESANFDFKGYRWQSPLAWQPIIEASHFNDKSPTGSSANVKRGDTQLAIFKVNGKYYATQQMCPHKRAFVLSDGLIGDDPKTGVLYVSCPQHKRNFTLNDGTGSLSASGEVEKEKEEKNSGRGSCLNDDSMNVATFDVEERADGWVYLLLPSVEELDSVLGTKRWMVRKEESSSPFEELDKKLREEKARSMKGRKGVIPGIDGVNLNKGSGCGMDVDTKTNVNVQPVGGGCGAGAGLDW